MSTCNTIKGHNDCERLVYSLAEAGALPGISRAFAYELLARDELPVITRPASARAKGGAGVSCSR